VISTIYIAPVLAFIIGFLLLSAPLFEKSKIENRNSKFTTAILWCVILGVLLNNLIDYAIFEPGVYMTFWTIIACMIAENRSQKTEVRRQKSPLSVFRLLSSVFCISAGVLIFIVFVCYAWLPVLKSTTKIQQAHKALSIGQFQQAHTLFAEAGEYDKLDPTALNMNGRLYLQQYNETGRKQLGLLKNAEECFKQAIARNKADFKNYEKLSDVYELLGQTQEAYDWCQKATQLYPGSDRLHFKLAQIAEQLGETNTAIEQYSKAIEIEDSFRHQFRMMYPERKEIVSRLGEDNYQFAIKRVKELVSGE